MTDALEATRLCRVSPRSRPDLQRMLYEYGGGGGEQSQRGVSFVISRQDAGLFEPPYLPPKMGMRKRLGPEKLPIASSVDKAHMFRIKHWRSVDAAHMQS